MAWSGYYPTFSALFTRFLPLCSLDNASSASRQVVGCFHVVRPRDAEAHRHEDAVVRTVMAVDECTGERLGQRCRVHRAARATITNSSPP
jgi:hypothetical protein